MNPAEQVPVSAYGGSFKNLTDLMGAFDTVCAQKSTFIQDRFLNYFTEM